MEVKIYTVPDCVQCEMTKKQFDLHGVKYTAINLSSTPEALADIEHLGYASAPVIVAGEVSWSGFKYDRINGLVKMINAQQAKDPA
jgi:glutaredoxin-like protein NrdH